MLKINKIIVITFLITTAFSACKDDKVEPSQNLTPSNVPEFFAAGSDGIIQPQAVKLSQSNSRILNPTDLDFNPTRPGEVWVTNEGTESSGGTTVRISNVNAETYAYDYRKDGNSWHFMALPTALAFSETGDWATTSGILDANRQGGSFTGPTLWSGDLDIYARPSGGNGSHLDMLHGSPYSMGIASEKANVYWVFDGYNKHICRYDFSGDHGAGNADHGDGKIQRFTNIPVKRNGTVPSHMIMSADKNSLYVVDGGNKQVLKVDVASAKRKTALAFTNEILADHSEWNAPFEVLTQDVDFNFCGIAINDNRLFVSDFTNGNIRCIDIATNKEVARIETGIEGITGLAIYENELFFVSYKTNALYKLEAR